MVRSRCFLFQKHREFLKQEAKKSGSETHRCLFQTHGFLKEDTESLFWSSSSWGLKNRSGVSFAEEEDARKMVRSNPAVLVFLSLLWRRKTLGVLQRTPERRSSEHQSEEAANTRAKKQRTQERQPSKEVQFQEESQEPLCGFRRTRCVSEQQSGSSTKDTTERFFKAAKETTERFLGFFEKQEEQQLCVSSFSWTR